MPSSTSKAGTLLHRMLEEGRWRRDEGNDILTIIKSPGFGSECKVHKTERAQKEFKPGSLAHQQTQPPTKASQRSPPHPQTPVRNVSHHFPRRHWSSSVLKEHSLKVTKIGSSGNIANIRYYNGQPSAQRPAMNNGAGTPP